MEKGGRKEGERREGGRERGREGLGREGEREGGIRERNWKKMYTVFYDLLQTWAKEVGKIKS